MDRSADTNLLKVIRRFRKAKSASEGLFADVADSDDGEEAMEEDMQLEGLAQVDGENVAVCFIIFDVLALPVFLCRSEF